MKKIQELFRKLYSFLSREEKKEADKLLLLIIVMAILDAIGVASIMPFMTIVTDQQTIHSNMFINSIYKYMEFKSSIDFIWFMGVVVLSILLFSLVVKSYTNYKLLRFIANQEYTIGTRLLDKYLTQDYAWHINTNSALLGKNILAEVSAVIGAAMIPMMNLISHGAITIAIITMLMFTNVELSLMVGFGLGSAYIFIYFIIRKYLEEIGKERYVSNSKRFFVVSEAFKAIKAIKIESLEKVFLERFKQPSNKFAKSQSSAQILSLLPRYGMEAIAFGGVIIVTLYLLDSRGGLATSLPTLSLFAMAGYKIMPSLQAMFNAITQLKFTKETVNKLFKDYHQVKNIKNGIQKELKFESDIKLNSIDYSFNKEGSILNQVSMEIIKGTYVAIIGKTGCGKSTLIDILMGLLEPKNGEIYIDKVKLEEIYYRSWREKIGYVPQQIPLTDSTILKNILLGKNDEDMDEERIQEVIELSCLTEVIDSLENGLESEIGEGGIKLSGGQKQRIGIARALYKRPSILILDEATSAMDQKTESIVIENLKKIKDITIISITHRLSTIKDCDNIFIIENGVLVESGSYNQIKKTDFFNRISTDIN